MIVGDIRVFSRVGWGVLLLAALALLPACGLAPTADNPAFPLSVETARTELNLMRGKPVAPARPIVVIGGLFDVGLVADDLGARIRELVSPSAPLVVVSPFGTSTIEDCRRKVIAAVERAHPSADPNQTVSVDVIGFSLGGIVARYAALEGDERGRLAYAAGGDSIDASDPGFKRLNVARLYCLATPNLGAEAADPPSVDDRVLAIRRGSALLAGLNAAWSRRRQPAYEVQAYVRLEDRIVGPVNAGLPDMPAWWVSNLPLQLAHADAYKDPRILADIGRRLRGERPYTRGRPIPVPASER